ncbi:hypothetical protein G3I60_30080 [Streptomyces sp. SID13666]|uniref:hypothetical protein n=1 Tax=unclassified Streptomyces TaxID=2593676 RepID=UPI0013C0D926|nr:MULTISPECIES: hypothetical protein [unclassified Streptomyces]NEA58291.1 hypothetical protein [Streptomyces sp. SID13666]NEA76581.1 hypothetical protein [Streptomyces sp. SID13588]
MTSLEPVTLSQSAARHLAWLAAVTGFVAIVAVAVLALTGHAAAAAAVGGIGGGVSAATSIHVSVRVRR